ncbi:two-component system histidine kinase PnpS [Brevibacillus massiliensis]|uniref:two-component system histidine kinase PnpS n=1 Tax=Brevibacillus massiliensis TaxID=1118054 RepID=UPI0002D39D2C|nr:ATP-binding protein [Brevibacillus massiliensis]
MNRFRLKLTLTILALISVVILLMGAFFAKVLEKSYVETLTDLLEKETLLISETVHSPEVFGDSAVLADRVQQFVQALDGRITVVDKQGRLLFDSEGNSDADGTLADLPEFRAALAGQQGISQGYSEPAKEKLLFVAVPVVDGGQVIGAVRSAMSMKSITDVILNMWFSLLTGLFIALVGGSILSARLSYGIVRPIEEMTRVARNITQREFEGRVRIKAKDEIGQLASAINFMASSLEQQMYEISENQQRLTGVLTNMTSGVMFVTEQRRIMLVNPAVEKLLGRTSSELVGKLHIEAGNNYELSRYIDKCIAMGEKIRGEIHTYDPVERILDINVAPYINAKGEAKGAVVVLHDITEIRRLEKMRSEFVANVSHELRTPVTSIKGFTETLLDGALQDEETCRQFLQIIADESERLFRLITEILDLSRIEQKKITLQLVEVNVRKLIHETAKIVQEQVSRKHLKLILPPEEDVMLTTDKDCLRQILLNLMSNAIAYTPEGGTITWSVEQADDRVQIRVTDTGIGIPEKDLGRVFERFYRVEKARSRDTGGTGLGLAIVKHLVESLHGTITVESEEGVGSTFCVTLPREGKP